jgi:lysophospholipase L1-like esterase
MRRQASSGLIEKPEEASMKPGLTKRICQILVLLAAPLPSISGARAADPPILFGLGDSIGAGVQSADANLLTQPTSYLKLIARQMSIPFILPWVDTNPFGVAGSAEHRERVFPFLASQNLAVSGATADSLLNQAADAETEAEIDSETDLMLFPRRASQMQIAEVGAPAMIVCWIGNNDVLSAVLSFDQLDASQMTSVTDFAERFAEIVQRSEEAADIVVFGNIPDVTAIGFLVDGQDLVNFLGPDFYLPEGHLTTIVAMFLIQLGFDDGSLLQDPDFVLDPSEIVAIQQRIDELNQSIDQEANAAGRLVADINSIFADFVETPPVIGGIALTSRFLGGLFSLDGVHPSNSGHALVANAFIESINGYLDLPIPPIRRARLASIVRTDPFVDKDGDGVVAGRPLAGLLETLGPFLGISGDADDLDPDAMGASLRSDRRTARALLARLADELPSDMTRDGAVRAFRLIFRVPVTHP